MGNFVSARSDESLGNLEMVTNLFLDEIEEQGAVVRSVQFLVKKNLYVSVVWFTLSDKDSGISLVK